MVFSANPLSLSVPEPVFESWLRDSGYLEILDERTTTLHNRQLPPPSTTTTITTPTLFSHVITIFSLFTINPLAKLTANDFNLQTPSWTRGFIGFLDCYSFPSSGEQAKLRVHENVKRYARNYSTLFLLFFACSLYQMPVALFGLIGCLVLWDLFKWCSERWGFDRYPSAQQSLIRLAQCGVPRVSISQFSVALDVNLVHLLSLVLAFLLLGYSLWWKVEVRPMGILMKEELNWELAATAIILYFSSVQMALFCAIAVSYAVTILHASLRKLSPLKQPTRADGNKWFQQSRNRS
ncbi:hypothetical protein IFM89_031771 [Coptis chinensis]|uniref:PRA1 family protein n=1 Tax=Coptis chinensis TaxID=261450 RepID=A0A835LF52_9MAGN|nr:hypothetical protein IFM89_031771 [Coptis chinensis]